MGEGDTNGAIASAQAEDQRTERLNRIIDASLLQCEKALKDQTIPIETALRVLRTATPLIKMVNDSMLKVRALQIQEARSNEARLRRIREEELAKNRAGQKSGLELLEALLAQWEELPEPIRAALAKGKLDEPRPDGGQVPRTRSRPARVRLPAKT